MIHVESRRHASTSAAATAAEADAACAARGEVLCGPDRAPASAVAAWTSRRCSSCWISSDVFREPNVSWTACTAPSARNVASVDDFPVAAEDNYKKPGGWNGGRLAVRREDETVVATCADPATRRPFACCEA